MRASHVGVCVVLVVDGAGAGTGRGGARVSCDGLTSLRLPHATVTSAAEVAAGAFTPPTAPGRGVAPALAKTMAGLQPFCRVQITSKPTADSDIKIEVWLPASRLQRKASSRRQWRMGRHDSVCRRWLRRWRAATPPPAPTPATRRRARRSPSGIRRSSSITRIDRCTRWRCTRKARRSTRFTANTAWPRSGTGAPLAATRG